MTLPQEHRQAIQVLAGQWRDTARARRRHHLTGIAAIWSVIVPGAALLAFPDTLAASVWLVTPPTGLFVWGGWYKLYRTGPVRRDILAEEGEIGAALASLCGRPAAFIDADARIEIDGGVLDPFSDGDYG